MKKIPSLKKSDITRIADFLFEIGTLRKVARAHRQTLLEDDLTDSIATHSFRSAFIAWFIAKQESANPERALLMALLHDFDEIRSNDHNWVHKKYVKVFGDEIARDQFLGLPGGEVFEELVGEYFGRKTKEARIAKDADLLDQILLLREYAWRGNKEAELWLKSKLKKKNQNHNSFSTETAKKLLKELYRRNPSDWWKDIWTSKRR